MIVSYKASGLMALVISMVGSVKLTTMSPNRKVKEGMPRPVSTAKKYPKDIRTLSVPSA